MFFSNNLKIKLMSKLSKEYIECRIFILGDEKVGKKSFVQKILNLPCTTLIHDIEAEKKYNKLLEQYKSDVELDKKMQEEQQALLLSMNNMTKSKKDNNDITTSRVTSTNTLFRIDDDKTSRKTKTNIMQNERTNLNIATTTRNLQGTNNPSSTLIGTISGNYQKKILREPVPEYPAKLYCVDMNKVVIKIFCIPKAEKRPPDFIPRDEDEEYELEKEHNISFDGIKDDLNNKLSISETCISSEKLLNYNISVFTLFIFLYDMSDFYSFESLILYYSKITKLFNFTDNDNFKFCIIGNKKDKKVLMEAEQNLVFTEFLKNTNLKKFEASTKPFYQFDNFFLDFFFQIFSLFEQTPNELNQKLFENEEFKEQFKKIIKSRPNLARAKRGEMYTPDYVPGPEYNINIYSFNSTEEINQIFTDRKSRFNKKIFTNKKGPLLYLDKSEKFSLEKEKEKEQGKNVINMEVKNGVFGKYIKGYSFGISKGNLNLVQKRKELRTQRSNDFYDNLDKNSSTPLYKMPEKKSRDENYFIKALKKKFLYKQNIIQERQLKLLKILDIHNHNLSKIEQEKETKNQKILLQKSASSINLLSNNNTKILSLEDETKEKERNLLRQKFHDALYGKNHLYIEKYNKKRSEIKLSASMQMEPEPYYIDLREKILNPLKGKSFSHKYNTLDIKGTFPKYKLIKDEFDEIVEKGIKKKLNLQLIQKSKEEEKNIRQKIEEKENEKEMKNLSNFEKNEEKRNKWIINKIEKNLLKKKKIQQKRAEKLLIRQKLLKEEENKKKIIFDLKREISIQKGHGDPIIQSPINYSLVEESSPKYSIKGRYTERTSRNNNDIDLVLGTNIEMVKYIREAQKNQALPNFNYIKPKIPSIIFNKAVRFPNDKNIKDDEQSLILFEDGIFQPEEHKDFICKEPMSERSQRGKIGFTLFQSPPPGHYKIKSIIDQIIEKNHKINKNKLKIRHENSKSNANNEEKSLEK